MKATDSDSPEFDRFAASYAELLEDPIRNRFARDPLHFHTRKWLLIQSLLQRAGRRPDTQRWLDAGCGKGELLRLAGSNFRQAAGCDPSSAMLSDESPFPVHKQRTLVDLPFEDNSFDFVTAVCVYHHVHGSDRRMLTNEISRVLTPGGLCCIIEHNPWNPATQAIVRRCPVDSDADLLSAGKAIRILKDAGFTAAGRTHFLFLPERAFLLLGELEKLLEKIPAGGQYAVMARNGR